MLLHSDTLSWFWANQSWLFLLNAVCLAYKKQTPVLYSGLTQTGLDPTIYHTQSEHANLFTTNVAKKIIDMPQITYSFDLIIKYILLWTGIKVAP
jgi:hypothetical protein